MEGILTLYRIGRGPSSSHTLGPSRAAELFLKEFNSSASFRAELYGSLALTGRGHGTDKALKKVLGTRLSSIIWYEDQTLAEHPNGLRLTAFDTSNAVTGSREIYSVGGGKIIYPGVVESVIDYEVNSFGEILAVCQKDGIPLWEFAYSHEPDLEKFLHTIWVAMQDSIKRGFEKEGILPGGLKLNRKAALFEARIKHSSGVTRDMGYLFACALAVSEENADGGIVVTAPTCGSAGVLPSVLSWFNEMQGIAERRILRAMAVAGIIGVLVRHNASISGAEVGCQGEVGTACAMAAGAATHLLGGSPRQVEYAAEMGLEHHLGLTCDPVLGLVQIPCIERNAMAAARAVEIAVFAMNSDGRHSISFDRVVQTMFKTGKDLTRDYRETALGGLARFYRHPLGENK